MSKGRSKEINVEAYVVKKILFFIIVLFIAVNINAQTIFIPDSADKPIKMPGDSWDLRSNFEIGHKSSYRYIVSDTSLYYAVFKNYPKDRLPLVDFNVHELVLQVYCPQCMASCPTNDPCHRNSCNYKSNWYIRKKKIGH